MKGGRRCHGSGSIVDPRQPATASGELRSRFRETDGLELLELIKRRPNLPVIILTGIGYSEEAMAEALSMGAAAYVSKGLSASHLVMEIRRILGNGKTAEPI